MISITIPKCPNCCGYCVCTGEGLWAINTNASRKCDVYLQCGIIWAEGPDIAYWQHFNTWMTGCGNHNPVLTFWDESRPTTCIATLKQSPTKENGWTTIVTLDTRPGGEHEYYAQILYS